MITTKAPPQTLDGDWMTVKETARYLKCAPGTVRRLVLEGKLTGKKLGAGPNSHLRISAVSIEKLMESK